MLVEFKKLCVKECHSLTNIACGMQINSQLVYPNDKIPVPVFSLLKGKQRSKLGGVTRAIKY